MNNKKYKDFEDMKGAVLAYGHFNTIHPGHIRYLKHAKDIGNKLVIALIGDSKDSKKQKFTFKQKERAESLKQISIVSKIFCLEDNELLEVVENLKPSFLILGKEFETTKDPIIRKAVDLQKKEGRKVKFHAGEIHYANTDLLDNSEYNIAENRRKLFLDACSKQSINKENILKSIDEWRNQNVVVIGDTILDQYSACEPIGMSAEAPIVVVKELANKYFIGGAAIVAAHINSLGGNCEYISIVGGDNEGRYVENEIKSKKIGNNLIVDTNRPTTLKKRYLVENQKLFRVSRLDNCNIDSYLENQIINKVKKLSDNANCFVISDFVYGVITDKILEAIKEIANNKKIKIVGDLQCSSQIGSITKFQDFSLICPNEREARIALQDNISGLEVLSQKIIESTNVARLVMKLGSEGFISYDFSNISKPISQSFPALSVNPVDVTGAGDSLLAVMSLGLANNDSMMLISAIACSMASLSVENMGNVPIKAQTLKEKIINLFE